MKGQRTVHARQLEEVALFLEEHPGFSPELKGEDALVCGFCIGASFLSIAGMIRLVAARPHFDVRQEETLLLTSRSAPAPTG